MKSIKLMIFAGFFSLNANAASCGDKWVSLVCEITDHNSIERICVNKEEAFSGKAYVRSNSMEYVRSASVSYINGDAQIKIEDFGTLDLNQLSYIESFNEYSINCEGSF